jgi:hypothetical protein
MGGLELEGRLASWHVDGCWAGYDEGRRLENWSSDKGMHRIGRTMGGLVVMQQRADVVATKEGVDLL